MTKRVYFFICKSCVVIKRSYTYKGGCVTQPGSICASVYPHTSSMRSHNVTKRMCELLCARTRRHIELVKGCVDRFETVYMNSKGKDKCVGSIMNNTFIEIFNC